MESVKEYKLGEVCEIVNGISFKPGDYTETGDPVIKAKNIRDGRIFLGDLSYYDPLEQSIGDEFKVKKGDLVIVKVGKGSVGKIGLNSNNITFLNGAATFKLEPNENSLNKKYLYHFLLNSERKINNLVTKGVIENLYKSSLEKLIIPLPPLQEQKRIAMILDQFMELERELVMRKKQYEYYRDLLIQKSLQDHESKEYELGEICEIVNGISFKSSEYTPEGMPIINVKHIQNDRIQTKNLLYCNPENHPKAVPVKPGDIVIAGWGTPGKVGMNTTNMEFFSGNSVLDLIPDENILDKKYLYHFLLNSKREINELIKPGGVDHLYKSSLAQLKIIVPPIEEQKRIASILDKFSGAGISGELEKEISLRHDQYEYYRDHLIASSKEI